MTEQEGRRYIGFSWLIRSGIFVVPQSQYEPRFLVAREDAVAAVTILCQQLIDRFEVIVVDRFTQLAIVSCRTLQLAWDLNPDLVRRVVPSDTLKANRIGEDDARS